MSAVEADIIFMPYNYLMDDESREGSNIDLTNAILIIDEAHNIKSFSEEVSNFSISAETLSTILKELSWIEDGLKEGGSMGPGIDITRGLVNHLINYIQNEVYDFD